ncbi:MAG: NAD(P)-dependent oxidoreductase [Phycisphaerales bacterium]|nr:NAD(P)-dependent oxidoreductase [Phycisphaerales bacterium]
MQRQDIRVGWVGLGVMGLPMARHLKAAGYTVVANTRTHAKANALIEEGGIWAASAREVAESCDVLFAMVGMPSENEEVFFGKEGVFAAAQFPNVLIDMSTSEPAFARRVDAAARVRGAHALDAPVSGGDVGARNASLSIMIGGDAAVSDRMQPLFAKLGKNIVRQGDSGAGQMTKLVNQVCVAMNTLGMCEGIVLAQRAGLDAQAMLDCISGGAASSWSLTNLAPRILRGDLDPGFFILHLAKDLRLARAAAQELGLDLVMVERASKCYEDLVAAGFGKKGTHAAVLLHSEACEIALKQRA